MKKPLLLAPCGSFEALNAAISAGADEVYFGSHSFNARYGAKNFDNDEMRSALDLCRIHGVKSNITVNTCLTDRELKDALNLVYNALCMGADCFIVQDLGLASAIKRTMPETVLHASTQCACHSLEGAKKLRELGFDRVVLAREMSFEDIKSISDAGIETEIFVHGALCVCHSGMCLMSSVIGKRSGNRGMCAQPCRLPYTLSGAKNAYPLSLKDMSLSKDIDKVLSSGAASLKIEGRRKSPEYVYGVTSIWRKLIDEGKNASEKEYERLCGLFSRGGFTDSYFTSHYLSDNRNMYGVRSEDDKQSTSRLLNGSDKAFPERKREISLECTAKPDEPLKVCASCGNVSVNHVSDFICGRAKSAPVTKDEIALNLSKLGSTPFSAHEIRVDTNGDVFLPKSALNAARRSAADALYAALTEPKHISTPEDDGFSDCIARKKVSQPEIHISFVNLSDISEISAYKNVKYVSLPLEFFEDPDVGVLKKIKSCGAITGVRLPRVIFNTEYDGCLRALEKAAGLGAKYALVSNIGHADMAKKVGLSLFGGIGLNVFNSRNVSVLESLGFDTVTLSPELNSAQMRDIKTNGKIKLCAFAKGRLPLMTLESCIVRANGKCEHKNSTGCALLTDRKGYKFPVYGEKRFCGSGYPCRNIIYNSVSADILSKKDEISKINADILTVII